MSSGMHENLTAVAGVAITAGQMLEFDTDGTVILATALTEVFAGVAVTDAALGGNVAIQTVDVATLVAGGAIVPGAKVAVKVGQKLQASATYPDVIGVALDAAAADGDSIRVLLK